VTKPIAIILAGGRGTRSSDPSRAKVAIEIGGKSLLEFHLQLLHSAGISQVSIIAGHAFEQVEQALHNCSFPELDLEFLVEPSPSGTIGALRYALQTTRFSSSEVLVILGDVLMSFPVEPFLKRWRRTTKAAAVVAHPNRHFVDSDGVFRSFDGKVKVTRKQVQNRLVPNMASAGVFALRVEHFLRASSGLDIGSDLLPILADSDELYVHVVSHYLMDTGTSTRLQRARADVVDGSFIRRGSLEPRPAIFLDRDGVVNPNKPEVLSAETLTLREGVAEAIEEVNSYGVPVFVVTNQPAIAKGLMSYSDHELVRARMDQLLADKGAFVDDYVFCPHHPDAGFLGEIPELKVRCPCRKPEVGLFEFLVDKHKLDLKHSIHLGDSFADYFAAQSLGIEFIHVAGECLINYAHVCVDDPGLAVLLALRRLQC